MSRIVVQKEHAMGVHFENDIRDIYRVNPDHFFPYVGPRYVDREPHALRLMGVGINAYVADAEWARQGPDPTWLASWFTNATYRYQRRVLKDLDRLAQALNAEGLFQGRQSHGRASVYATNAIKVYLPASKGKQAAQLAEDDFERHREQWHQELRLMAAEDLLPHVLVIFGQLPWAIAWQAFYPSPSGPRSGLTVHRYETPSGPSRHHANRITVEAGGGQKHEMLLLRLRHPSGRSATGSPTWLLQQPDFRSLAGLTPLP